jgi:butyrate kinase
MFDIETSFNQEIQAFEKYRPTVIFVEALDPRVVEAVCCLARFVRPVFLASEDAVRAVAAEHLDHVDPNRLEFTLSESAFVEIDKRTDLVDEFAQAHAEFCREQGSDLCLGDARSFVSQPAHFGIWAVRLDHADTVVAGARHQPKDYFRPMLRLLSKQPICSEAGVFVLPDEHPTNIFPHNIVVFGDVGVNATMTPEVLAHVAVGTCAVARDLIPEEVLPRIHGVIVSYSNRGSDEGPSPERVRQATALVPEVLAERVRRGARYGSIQIEGEVKVSAAVSERSAMYYEQGSEARGEGGPNVIICPNLEMGNLLYHLYASRFPAAKKFPALFGVRFRGVDLAMDCTPEDIRLAVKASVLRMYRFGEWERTPRDTFFRRYRVLAVNPGSTSTRISVYEGEEERFTTELKHPADELLAFEGKSITAQYAFRKDIILKALAEQGYKLADIDAVAGRGGLVRPIPHGTYAVTNDMLEDLRESRYGEHASNLGALIAREVVGDTGRPAYIVDPVVVDEVPNRVKVTGIKAIRRKVVSHALNQIATARRYAEEQETFYERVNVIVAHMGGGITVGAHRHGRYIDVNNGLDGEGPFSPQRSGSLPTGQLIDACFSERYTRAELKQLNKGRGGLIDLLGTADLREVERRIAEGDREAAEVFEALTYQIAKQIASVVPAFDGEPVERILLTGGMARSRRLVAEITRLVAALGCGVSVYPGENEMIALAKGALRVLSDREEALPYEREARVPAPSPAG